MKVASTLLNAVRGAPGTGAQNRARDVNYGLGGPVVLTPYAQAGAYAETNTAASVDGTVLATLASRWARRRRAGGRGGPPCATGSSRRDSLTTTVTSRDRSPYAPEDDLMVWLGQILGITPGRVARLMQRLTVRLRERAERSADLERPMATRGRLRELEVDPPEFVSGAMGVVPMFNKELGA